MPREKMMKLLHDLNYQLHDSILRGNVRKAMIIHEHVGQVVSYINDTYPEGNPMYQHRSGLGIEVITNISDRPIPAGVHVTHTTKKKGGVRHAPFLCACGCGEEVGRPPAIFCRGHDAKMKKKFKEVESGRVAVDSMPPDMVVRYKYWKKTGSLARRGNTHDKHSGRTE